MASSLISLPAVLAQITAEVDWSEARLLSISEPYRVAKSNPATYMRRSHAVAIGNVLPKSATAHVSENQALALAVSMVGLGRFLADEGKLAEAESLFAGAVAIRQRWLFENSPMARIVELTVPLSELGHIARSRGQLELAQRVYSFMRELLEQAIVQESHQRVFFVGLSSALQHLSAIALAIGDTVSASKLAEEAETAMSQVPLTPSPDRPMDTQLLARGALAQAGGLHSKAKALEVIGETELALRLFAQRVAQLRQLTQLPVVGGPRDTELALAAALCDQSRLLHRSKRWSEALVLDEEATRLLRGLLNRNGSGVYEKLTLAIALCGKGQETLELGDLSASRQAFEEALAVARETAAMAPDLKPATRHVGVTLSHLSKLQHQLGMTEEAVISVRESLNIARKQYIDEPVRVDREIDLCCCLALASRNFEAERSALQTELRSRLDQMKLRGIRHFLLAELSAENSEVPSADAKTHVLLS